MSTIKRTDLHMHPHFDGPQSGKRVPSLKKIVDHLIGTGLDICAISACHPAANHTDRRFHDYMLQLAYLEGDFEVDYHGKEGFLRLRKRVPMCMENTGLIILNSQEVRTSYRGMPADINVIGVFDFIEAGKDIDETAKIAQDKGGIVTVCHPGSRCGVGLEKAIEMIDTQKVDAVEGWDATESRGVNERVVRELKMKDVDYVAVSDAHHYTQAGAAYSTFGIEGQFSMGKLKEAIVLKPFEVNPGQVGFLSKHYYHTLPILMSVPGNMLKTPGHFIRTLKKR